MPIFARLLMAALLMLAAAVTVAADAPTKQAITLMPLPASIEFQRGTLRLPQTLTHSLNASISPRLSSALERFASRIHAQTGSTLRLTPTLSRPLLDFRIANAATDRPRLDTDESYTLSVDLNGISLAAETVYGAMHGLQTLRQLIRPGPAGDALELPLLRIHDRPRFAWRGMLLDTARNFMPTEAVERLLDAMEMVKLNVLHLHVSDDQGFRVESAALPELHRQGSNGEYYRRHEIQALVAYAADRGIRVVPEFGLPGHSTSWQIGYPELSSARRPPQRTGVYDGMFSAPVNPASESTYRLIDTLIQDMATLFPDHYWHIGGDEVDAEAWRNNADIQRYMADNGIADSAALQAHFTRRYVSLLQQHQKIAVGWQEVLHPEIPPQTVLHLWTGTSFDATVTRHPLLSSVNYYLDHQQPAWFMYRRDPTALALDSGDATISDRQLLGAALANWSETMTAATLDLRTWPRSAAVAELFWSPQEQTTAVTRTDLYRRLAAVDERLHVAGIAHRRQPVRAWTRLAGDGDADALITLASVLEPAGMHSIRGRRATVDVLQAFIGFGDYPVSDGDRLVESLPAESVRAQRFNQRVDHYLSGASEISYELELQLHEWANNHAQLAATIKSSPALCEADIDQVSKALQDVANIGITAMQLLADSKSPGWFTAWRLRARLDDYDYHVLDLNSRAGLLQLIANQLKPNALARHHIAIQPGVSRLLEAALNQ